MTNLTFYGSVGEIGGNKVLLEDRDARIWLDMGATFDFGSEYFVEYLTPRERFGLRDYFALGLLPRLPGLYAADWLESAGLPHEAPRFSAAFISHIHFDHTNHLRFLDAAIPVHLGIGTKIILDSWEITTRGMDLLAHDYCTFRTGAGIDVDGVEVEPIHVDHSAPAAYGFLVHTAAGTVAYTGDLRGYGPHADLRRGREGRRPEVRRAGPGRPPPRLALPGRADPGPGRPAGPGPARVRPPVRTPGHMGEESVRPTRRSGRDVGLRPRPSGRARRPVGLHDDAGPDRHPAGTREHLHPLEERADRGG